MANLEDPNAEALAAEQTVPNRSHSADAETQERASKAAVFAGWKDMDQYMRDNSIVGMPSEGALPEAPGSDKADAGSKS